MLEDPFAAGVFLKQVAVVELVHDGPEFAFGVAAESAEIAHAQRVELAVAGFDDGDGFLAGHHAVADVAGRVVGGGGVAEFGVLEPGVDQVGARVDLVEVLGVVGAVPFVGQVVEAVGLGDLIVLVAVPRHKVAEVERVELGAFFGRRGQGQAQVVLGDAVADKLLHREADGHAVLDLVQLDDLGFEHLGQGLVATKLKV